MGERRGTKGLELWCKRLTEGYPGVKVDNMTTSWRDGLAFCAIIHHFRPDLIDFKKLKKEEVYKNNELAFRVAEQYMGIPALLEAEDMVEYAVPDRLSILTYLSQFYQAFAVTQASPSRLVPKRPATTSGIVSPASTSPPNKKMPIVGGGLLRREPCSKCHNPVFLAERLSVGKHLYHRTCFRCARCNNQLTLSNYYETETPNQYCCETCPDEEKPSSPDNTAAAVLELDHQAASALLTRSLSDEEKSAGLKRCITDSYSEMFESTLERPEVFKTDTLTSSGFTKARASFLQVNMLQDDNSDAEDGLVPSLPFSARPSIVADSSVISYSEHQSDIDVNINTNSDQDSGRPDSADVYSKDDSSGDQLAVAAPKVQTTDDSPVRESSVRARARLFENKGDRLEDTIHKPFTTKVTQTDLSTVVDAAAVTEPNVPVEEQRSEIVRDTNLVIVADESVSVKVADKSNDESEENESNYQSIVDDTNETFNSSHDNIFSKTVYKTTCEDLNETVNISNTEYKTICEDSIITVSDESIEEPIVISDTDQSAETTHEYMESESSSDKLQSKEESQLSIETDSMQTIPAGHSGDIATLTRESYPGVLNPFGDDNDKNSADLSSTNPFGDSDEDDSDNNDVKTAPTATPRSKRIIRVDAADQQIFTPGKPRVERISEIFTVKPVPAVRIKLQAPRISLNPFGSDEEVEEEEEELSMHYPRHSSRRSSGDRATVTKPRISDVSTISSPHGSSTTSLSSMTTTCTIHSARKKKAPAPPKPPTSLDSEQNSLTSSPSTSVQHSPRSTPRPRKSKKAPAPPSITSTPSVLNRPHPKMNMSPIILDNEKVAKDELNRNRQSQGFGEPTSPTDTSFAPLQPDKSTFGPWKRKKCPAPDKPIPIRRTIKALPLVEVKRELDIIEVQQQGLERQGVKLEHIIRTRCESADAELNEDNIPFEVEDLILQLFEVVNEKNDLCRRQAELMYLKKQHRLEEEYAEVEYQIRCLMLTPEQNKTDTDKTNEEELIQRLVNIVEKRNEIIECLDMDRVREHEEDNSVTSSMNTYTNRRDCSATVGTLTPNADDAGQTLSKKEKKKLKKKFKLKLGGGTGHHQPVDADKDIDETEVNQVKKEKKKKKFALF